MNRRATEDAAATPPVEEARPVIQHFSKWTDVYQVLNRRVFERLCGKDIFEPARQSQLSVSEVIVATVGHNVLGFVAFKPGSSGLRVAHELWVDSNSACGPVAVTDALVIAFEKDALASHHSKVFIVLPQTTSLRRLLQVRGYASTLEGADLLWFEKVLPIDCGGVR